MPRTIILLPCTVVIATIAACSSQPPPAPMPDGRTRQAINTPERIASFNARNQIRANDRQTWTGGKALAETGQSKERGKHQGTIHGPDALPSLPVETGDAALPQANRATIPLSNNELLELRPRSLVLSIPCTFGTADCQPSNYLAALLLRAATHSTRIEIRGRTDAVRTNLQDQLLAQRRAQEFKQYIGRQGVEKAKLHTSALAVGGHIADNSTADGRARNRRVEVEIMDIDPGIYARIPLGEHHEPH